MLSRLKTALRALLRKSQAETELDEELRDHIERQTEQNIRLGMNPEEARYAARKAFGGVEQAKEQSRDSNGVRWLEELWRDLRYGARMLSKRPGYTMIAGLTLALGIGANTAIFSVVNATLLNPLPYPQCERLVFIHEQRIAQGRLQGLISPADFFAWREQNRSFERMAAYTEALFNLTGDGEPERVWGQITTTELFATLGVRPMLGRDFTAEDGAPGAPGGVILGHGLWQRRFGAARDIVGKTIRLDGGSYTVVGVMPPGFQFIDKKFEVWRSFTASAEWRASRRFYYLTAVGRLKPGIAVAEARTDMEAIAERLERQFSDTNRGHGVNIVTFDEAAVGRLRPALYTLVTTVGFVLLIACANVASLSLARSSARQREMAVRASLGASRAALVRQMLMESLLLAFVGGAIGLLVAMWGVNLIVAAAPSNLPRLDQIKVDASALAFTFVVSALTGIASGLLPALQLSRINLSAGLKDGGQNAAGSRGRNRALNSLVVAEVALALALLVGAGLLIRSFTRLLEVAPGFASEKVLAIDVSLNGERFNNRRHIFIEQLTARVASLPGVVAVGATSHLPLSGEYGSRSFTVVGDATKTEGEKLIAEYRIVTPDYLRAMKIQLRAGRHFTARDRNEYFTADGRRVEGYPSRERGELDAPGVVIINDTLARRSFAGGNPLGRRIVIDDGQSREREIVGVVGDVKHFSLEDEAKPELYLPYAQRPTPNQTLVIRADSEPAAMVAAVRGEVRSLDKDLPLYGIKTMENYLDESVAARRLNTLLIGAFAAVALILAAVGIYGVISHSVTERTREIGIRMALGARSQDVQRWVVRRGMTLALAGVGAGLACALALTWLMRSLLFGVSATDPLTFELTTITLIMVALAACWIPARRATKVDPIVALHSE
jgi:putative ABC transport system permease protein